MSPKISTIHDMHKDWMLQQNVLLNIINALNLNYNVFHGNTQLCCIWKTVMFSNLSYVTLLAIDEVQRRVQLPLQKKKKITKSYQPETWISYTS